MSSVTDGSATDWRGTPITVGALCIYGAPVGRSIALVEAEVVGFTKSGRVNVKVLRRAYGSVWTNSKEVVNVGADRLVIVNELPPTEVPLMSEKIADKKARDAERDRVEATHDFPPTYWEKTEEMPYVPYGDEICKKCGITRRDACFGSNRQECLQ